MKTITFLKSALLAAMVCVGTTAAMAATIVPSKNYVTLPVKVNAPFDGLRTNTAIDIQYTVGPEKVQLYVPDNLAKYVKVTVSKGDLTVSYNEDMIIKGDHKTCLIVSAPDVTRFTVNSAGDIEIKSNLDTKKEISMKVNSAGDISSRKIKAPSVNLTTNSAGDIETGEIVVDKAQLTVNSAGDITTGAIKARESASLMVNSAGDIETPSVIADKNLSIRTGSAGDIKIKEASADHITVTAGSSGDVRITTLTALNVKLTCGSAGDINVGGMCSNAEMSAQSSGDIDAEDLKATSVLATTMSSGEIKCYAVERLEANRRSIGRIRYAGNPAEVVVSDTRREDGVSPL